MPQVILEYSANIAQPVETVNILGELTAVISAASDIAISNFKSRVIRREEFLAGGGADGAFVHLAVGVFSGKPFDVKRRIGEDCLEYLEEYFEEAAAKLDLQITVEIREMEKQSYFKSVSEKG